MSQHKLKIQPQPFADIAYGTKTSEVRYWYDRDFKVGDTVLLAEIDADGQPTGGELTRTITHIQKGFGLPHEYCVLSYACPHCPHCEYRNWLQGKIDEQQA